MLGAHIPIAQKSLILVGLSGIFEPVENGYQKDFTLAVVCGNVVLTALY